MHARVAPSSLYLTVACNASLTLQEQVPPLPDSEEEAEGKAAHWVAMRYAAGYGHELPVGAKFISEGRQWEVDLDMVLGAIMYNNAMGGYNTFLRLEQGVAIPRVHNTECTGTPDGFIFYPSYTFPPEVRAADPSLPSRPIKLLRVGEYKYGHRFVEVFENYQVGSYASGVMNLLQLTDNDPDLYLELVLVQPRSYHRDGPVRVWRGEAHMIRAIINIAHGAAERALMPNPEARTSEHCIDCKARHLCKTLQYATQTFIDFSTSPELVELPPEAMGQELMLVDEAIARLEARRTGLAAQAEALLRQGKAVAFYHMEAGQSRMIYRDDVDVDEVVGLGELLGIDLRKPQTKKEMLITPKQAIDVGVDPDVMKKYAFRPPAAQKLTRDSSITARKVFSK